MPITYCIESDTDVDDIDYDNEKNRQADRHTDRRQTGGQPENGQTLEQ